ncbi:MAG: hypothetical protein JWP34_4128 [Massilia sp.]|nr:hypothetical protein [Massilia sp.]
MKKPNTFSLTLTGAACAAAFLAACGGGGGGSAAIPAAPAPVILGTSTVSGTVTGFGSLIVDGVRIDDKSVAAGKERVDGAIVAAELKLGQHVEVEHDGSLVATKIRVNAEVEGSVSAIDLAAKSLTVLGQTIVVNADAALGPITVFDAPYTKLDEVKVADAVEIHGLIKVDAAGKATLQATRIEKKVADVADRVNGIVFDLVASAKTFKVGKLLIDYSNATVLPAGAVITNGNEVTVAIPVGTVEQGVAVKASAIKVKDRKTETSGKEVELGGSVSTFDTATKILTVNGVKVDVSTAKFDQEGKGLADLKLGAYIVVKGVYGADNVLKASTVVIRGVDQEKDKEVELHGTIVDFKSVADFKVRGVSVDATNAVIDAASCGANAHLGNDLQVGVWGSLSATGVVKITSVKCEKVAEGTIVVTRQGKVSKVDTTAKTFAITTSKETLTVQWNSATTFVDVEAAASLADKNVSVEATAWSTGLVAKKVSLIK